MHPVLLDSSLRAHVLALGGQLATRGVLLLQHLARVEPLRLSVHVDAHLAGEFALFHYVDVALRVVLVEHHRALDEINHLQCLAQVLQLLLRQQGEVG